MNPVKALQDHRQAVWLDFLSRGFIADGGLKKLVDDDGLRGVTSNPSIFEQAIGHTKEYDDGIKRLLQSHDQSPGQIFEKLAVEDIRSATDVLRPVFDATHGADGFVSIETASSVLKCRPISQPTRKEPSRRPSACGGRSIGAIYDQGSGNVRGLAGHS